MVTVYAVVNVPMGIFAYETSRFRGVHAVTKIHKPRFGVGILSRVAEGIIHTLFSEHAAERVVILILRAVRVVVVAIQALPENVDKLLNVHMNIRAVIHSFAEA